MDWWAFIELAAAVVLGGGITAYYARKSSKQLKREAGRLKQEARRVREMNDLILRGLEEGTPVKFNRDAEGNITGMVVNFGAHLKGGSDVSANSEVTRGEDARQPDESGEDDREAEDRGGA